MYFSFMTRIMLVMRYQYQSSCQGQPVMWQNTMYLSLPKDHSLWLWQENLLVKYCELFTNIYSFLKENKINLKNGFQYSILKSIVEYEIVDQKEFHTKLLQLFSYHLARPPYTFVCSDQALYCLLASLISQNFIMDSSKIERWVSPFKKFSRLIV